MLAIGKSKCRGCACSLWPSSTFLGDWKSNHNKLFFEIIPLWSLQSLTHINVKALHMWMSFFFFWSYFTTSFYLYLCQGDKKISTYSSQKDVIMVFLVNQLFWVLPFVFFFLLEYSVETVMQYLFLPLKHYELPTSITGHQVLGDEGLKGNRMIRSQEEKTRIACTERGRSRFSEQTQEKGTGNCARS